MAMNIASKAFATGTEIPSKYTCQGVNVSPPLEIGEVPGEAKSLALVVDDPDAPRGTWVHWVLYNLPPSTRSVAEGVATAALAGARDGRNDWKVTGYRGPCPPSGSHRYFFRLYALDTFLPDLHEPTKAALEKAMEGHVLAEASWMGVYRKK